MPGEPVTARRFSSAYVVCWWKPCGHHYLHITHLTALRPYFQLYLWQSTLIGQHNRQSSVHRSLDATFLNLSSQSSHYIQKSYPGTTPVATFYDCRKKYGIGPTLEDGGSWRAAEYHRWEGMMPDLNRQVSEDTHLFMPQTADRHRGRVFSRLWHHHAIFVLPVR